MTTYWPGSTLDAFTGLFWPGLYDVAAEDQRGPAYAAYLRSALANPDIVGCHWFQYVDEPLTGRLLDGENGNMGFVTVTTPRILT